MDESTPQLVLCQDAKGQGGSESGYFRQKRVGLLQVEPGNVNKKIVEFLISGII